MEISKELQTTRKDGLLVSYDFNSLYPSAQIDINSTWPKIETVYPFKKDMIEPKCSLFNSGRWNELKRSAFLILKYHNPKSLSFLQLSVKGKIKTHTKTIDLRKLIE